MMASFIPTLESPSQKSPIWYRNYHNAFYMSQLVNNVLLSYMTSYIEKLTFKRILEDRQMELLERGLVEKKETEYLGTVYAWKSRTDIYSIDIEDFLTQIIKEFQSRSLEIQEHLNFSGVGLYSDDNKKPYLSRSVNIDIHEIATCAENKNWYDIVKGFLNIWEFLFLFSITESAMKNILSDYSVKARDLIGKINKKYPEACLSLNDNHNISERYSCALWSVFVSIRNIYSHTHGIISNENKRDILRRAKDFKKVYNDLSSTSVVLDFLNGDAEELFLKDSMVASKFYLLPDAELNIFRNFVSEYVSALSKVADD